MMIKKEEDALKSASSSSVDSIHCFYLSLSIRVLRILPNVRLQYT